MIKNRKKKILIISNYFPPEKGAASNRIFNMANSINVIANSVVSVLCPLPNYPEGKIFSGYRSKLYRTENIEGINVNRIWTYSSNSKNAVLRLISMLSFGIGIWFLLPRYIFKKYDSVIIQSPPLISAYMAIVLFKLIRTKVYLNVSDLWPMSAYELGVISKGKFYSILKWIEKRIYAKADFIIGQSNEIIEHINKFTDVPKLLYRNLPKIEQYKTEELEINKSSSNTKIIYAGLIGAAQGIIDICENVNFIENKTEFHIYGMGNEVNDLKQYLEKNPNKGITFHGALNRDELVSKFHKYDLALIPLKNRIHGAVPSKLFEMISYKIPVVFMGGGEGAKIVSEHNIGCIIAPQDFEGLNVFLKEINRPKILEFKKNINNCINIFSFDKQEKKLIDIFN